MNKQRTYSLSRKQCIAYYVRATRKSDISAIEKIETSCYQFPWSRWEIEALCLPISNKFCHGRVLCIAEQVIGYAFTGLTNTNMHLMNLSIHPQWQGRGLGRCLLQHVLHSAQCSAVCHVRLEVRYSNLRAQKLYLSAGFRKSDLRRGFYLADNGREDAWVLEYEVGEGKSRIPPPHQRLAMVNPNARREV